MGGGTWSAATYAAVSRSKIDSGTAFGYDRHVRSTGNYVAHSSVDPTALNSAGENIRESRDSAEHPNSLPVLVGFDSTGSMGSVPRTVQAKLKTLFTLLQEYVQDPQVAVATYGDATCDRVPLQVSQFESDNRVDDALDNLFLEGGGGGNGGETSNLLLYYAATHMQLDAFEKRGRKGHLFLIADEMQVPITSTHVKKFVGDGEARCGLSFAEIAEAAGRMWNIHVLLIDNYAAKVQGSHKFYSNLFGPDAVLNIENPDTIAETIAAVVGFEEGVDKSTIDRDLSKAAGKEIATAVTSVVVHRAGLR